ncbi:MAG: FxLYD domain-containing protein [Armatimonadetes bacterium]|nr:FxLYD domain-containing protein [Armatimonadota bacterium]
MDGFDRKSCPECAERIPHAAKKCPFCKSPQGKTWWTKNPVLLAILPGLLYMAFALNSLHNTTSKPNYFFSDYVQRVPVTSSEMSLETSEGSRTVTVVGTIRNDTNIPWEHPVIEGQFYDKSGKLIDVVEDFYSSMTLMPHQEQAFRINGEASRPAAAYANHKIFLRHAGDAYHFSR